MSREDELTEAFLEAYRRTGNEVGYWGTRFLQAVRRHGGLATAKRMLRQRGPGQQKGLDALLEAGRPDLTVEAIVSQPRFRELFTDEELAVAAERLGDFGRAAEVRQREWQRLFPDDLEPGRQYTDGAKRTVRVNAYERDPRARRACLEHHGFLCQVCGFDFEAVYGGLGRGFIHVHHLKPLALADGAYRIDPVSDLVPVCPNCHAMLHREEPALAVSDLKARLQR
jgi:5-methylcytosine-specific restriction protein A